MSHSSSAHSGKHPYMRPEKMHKIRFWEDKEVRPPSPDFPISSTQYAFKVDEYENRWGLDRQIKLANGRDILK